MYDTIVLSPHLDDAVLSCGAQLAAATEAGGRVLVVTVFAADEPRQPPSEFVRKLHELHYHLDTDVVASRRDEDVAACARLGVEHLHWDLPECIYRVRDGVVAYETFASVFGAVAASDGALIDELTTRVQELPPHRQLLAPLAVGHHVDHVLVHNAAIAGNPNAEVAYYEDYPYAARWGAVRRTLRPRNSWRSRVIAVDDAAVTAKVEASACYASQIFPLFKSRERLDRKLRSYISKRGGERVWTKTP